MMDSVNTPRPTTRTLAVIDGGLNVKAPVHPLSSTGKPKLLEQVRKRSEHGTIVTRPKKRMLDWIKRFIFFHNKRHPAEMGEAEIGQFLSSLATEAQVSASTQNQALNALLFLYQEVLQSRLGLLTAWFGRKRPQRLPVVLTKDEVRRSSRSV